jgi:hypothetical protein
MNIREFLDCLHNCQLIVVTGNICFVPIHYNYFKNYVLRKQLRAPDGEQAGLTRWRAKSCGIFAPFAVEVLGAVYPPLYQGPAPWSCSLVT